MPKFVLDTTVLVSAFLRPVAGGAAFEVLRLVDEGKCELFLSNDILEETAGVLLRPGRLRERFRYSDDQVITYCQNLGRLAHVVDGAPVVQVVRDPNDDMIIGCALAAQADYLVSRDKDLLTLGVHDGIVIVTPEALLQILRLPQKQ